MKLKIEFYGRVKAEFGQAPIELDIQEQQRETTIEYIYLDLCKKHNCIPNTHIIKPILNDTFAEWSDPVKTNDVIGFFPPASGG